MDDLPESDDKTILIRRSQLQYEKAKLAASKPRNKTYSVPASGQVEPIGFLDRTLHVLPLGASGSAPTWVIALFVGNDAGDIVRVKVMGDVVMGVKRPRQQVPDLDLTDVGAESKGVSRRHALLHPGTDALYLIPLETTNGTRLNGILMDTGISVALKAGDVISLGGLHLALGIESLPEHLRSASDQE